MATSPQSSLAEQVMAYVRRAVDSGEMVTGAWYSAYQLADVLGMSRSPVREGLLRLEEAGLIQFTRNRGFQVVAITPTDIAEYFALRLAVEPATIFRAARYRDPGQLAALERQLEVSSAAAAKPDLAGFFRATQELHVLLLQMGNSHSALKLISGLRAHSSQLHAGTAALSRPLPELLEELTGLVECIQRCDPAGARSRWREHLLSTGRHLLEQALRNQGLSPASVSAELTSIWERYISGLTS